MTEDNKDDLAIFGGTDLEPAVQELRELLSQSRIAFLLGAGCSHKAGLPLMSGLTAEVENHPNLSPKTRQVLADIQAGFKDTDGQSAASIEDYMSELVDFLSVAERRKSRGAKISNATVSSNSYQQDVLKTALSELKSATADVLSKKTVTLDHHRRLIRAVHHSLQAGKASRSIDYFVLNYDTLVEDALGIERVRFCDGFAGGATGWWSPSDFDYPEVPARVFKLHGSIDWCLLDDDTFPRRVRDGLVPDAGANHVLIYPAATKFVEAQRDPFAHLIKRMRNSLCPEEGKETILAICGYSFSDAHIDLEIEQALRLSAGRLSVIAFVEQSEPTGRLKQWVDDHDISSQVRAYCNTGLIHKTPQIKVDSSVPWWKFEVLVRLLGGER